MSETGASWQNWVRRLAAGDAEVVGQFWDEYGPRLRGLADAYLTTRLARREGPEDVVQSVCLSFFRRVRGAQFDLAQRENLWHLLCAITVSKVRQKRRFHQRQKRSLRREQRLDAAGDDSLPEAPWFIDAQPTPDEQAAFVEQLEQLLAELDEEERRIVELKLQQETNQEAARQIGCSERTVRRVLERIERRWRRALEDGP
jgi:RNA polymerase sigma factor (sigma-70 family)